MACFFDADTAAVVGAGVVASVTTFVCVTASVLASELASAVLLSAFPPQPTNPVSYTHLTLPTNREV